MTGTEAIAKANQLLNDEGSNPHVLITHWYSYVDAAVKFFAKNHPESLSGSTIVTSAPAAITKDNIAEELPTTSDFDTGFVRFIGQMALDEDSEASGNRELSNHYLNKVEAGV